MSGYLASQKTFSLDTRDDEVKHPHDKNVEAVTCMQNATNWVFDDLELNNKNTD